MSEETTNLTTEEPATTTTPEEPSGQTGQTTPEPASTTPTTGEDARGKSNREARYRLRAKEAEAKAEEQEKQIAELQAQLKAQQEAYEQEKAAEARAALCIELDKKCFDLDRGIFAMMEGLPDDTLRDIAKKICSYNAIVKAAYRNDGAMIDKMRKIGDGSGTGWNHAF